MLTNHPSFSVLYFLIFCLVVLLTIKAAALNLSLYLIIIIFVRGILLLLFYLTLLNSNIKSWREVYVFIIFRLLPDFYALKNFKNFLNYSSLEFLNLKMRCLLLLIIRLIRATLIMSNLLLNKFKWVRQVN